MKKRISVLLIALLIALTSICGCGDTTAQVDDIQGWEHILEIEDNCRSLDTTVVARFNKNMPKFSIYSDTIDKAILKSAYTAGSVAFVAVEGSPDIYFQTKVPDLEVKVTSDKRMSIAEDTKTQVLNYLDTYSPSESEADTLKAISLAGKTLNRENGNDKLMVVMDNGLATKGYLNFSDGLLQATTDDIVEALQRKEAIPNLDGVTIIWMYLGTTAPPQAELSDRQYNRLEEIWKTVLEEGGANVYFTNDIPLSSDNGMDDALPCKTVDVEERDIHVHAEEIKDVWEEDEIYELDSETLNFVGDKDIFINEDEAKQVIYSLCEGLKGYDKPVYVIGTTATGEHNFCQKLSEDRAKRVSDIMEEYGIENVIPVGLAYDDPWHLPDIDTTGHQIEEIAKKNRAVRIMSKETYEKEMSKVVY